MLLEDALISLGRKRVAIVTAVSESMANKWFIQGVNKRTPDITSLVSLADHLCLDNEGLGELARNTACVRATIELEKLARAENPILRQGSIVAKLIRSNPILVEIHDEEFKQEKKKIMDLTKKEEILNEERESKIHEVTRQSRLKQIRELQKEIEETKTSK